MHGVGEAPYFVVEVRVIDAVIVNVEATKGNYHRGVGRSCEMRAMHGLGAELEMDDVGPERYDRRVEYEPADKAAQTTTQLGNG